VKSACAVVYEDLAVRWLLGRELHPGGEATTRRALELVGLGPADRLLDIASGAGTSALLAGREFGCLAAGIDYSEGAVRAAQTTADAAGLRDRVGFIAGDAEALPFPGKAFDAVLCECSLCTFPDKQRAVAEMRRVLGPGGRVAICDVVAEHDRLPERLRGAMATVACVGTALSREGYERLLAGAGFELLAAEPHDAEARRLAERVVERLRGARILGLDGLVGSAIRLDEAIALVGEARAAIVEGVIGYTIFAARRR
jgi:arsenite methyltransferase